jgi:hypothetical protein
MLFYGSLVVLSMTDADVCPEGGYGPGLSCVAADRLCAARIWSVSIAFSLIFSPMFFKLYRYDDDDGDDGGGDCDDDDTDDDDDDDCDDDDDDDDDEDNNGDPCRVNILLNSKAIRKVKMTDVVLFKGVATLVGLEAIVLLAFSIGLPFASEWVNTSKPMPDTTV